MRVIDENTALWILIVSVVIFIFLIGIEHAREEKAAIQEGKVSVKHIERIKKKIGLLSIIASDNSLLLPIVDGLVVYALGAVFLLFLVVLPFILADGKSMNSPGGILFLGIIAGGAALPMLWGKTQHFCRCQSGYLKNRLQFLEKLETAQRDGCDEVTLNAVKQELGHELQRRNENVPKLAHIEMIDEYVSRPRREGSLSARFAEALRDEASSRIESGEWLPGGKHPAHSRASDAGQRVATDENGKQLTIWDALMGRKSAAAQAEPEQKEETGRNTLMRTAEDVVASEEAAIEQLESYEGELKELAQEEIKMRRDAIRHAKEGDPEMARLLVGAANFQKTKREVLEKREQRLKQKKSTP